MRFIMLIDDNSGKSINVLVNTAHISSIRIKRSRDRVTGDSYSVRVYAASQIYLYENEVPTESEAIDLRTRLIGILS